MLVVILIFRLVTQDRMNIGLVGIGGTVLGITVFFGSTTALKMEETRSVMGIILRRLKRS